MPASPSFGRQRESELTLLKGHQMKGINRIVALVEDDSAQDLIEYAMLAGLLALATVGATQALGGAIINVFFVRISDMLDGLL